MSRDLGEFDFKKFLSLGREVSEKHPEFKFLAPLGNTYARKRAAIEFMEWLKKHSEASAIDKAKAAIEVLGKAELLTHVKEVGRLCLILGDTSERESWGKVERRPKESVQSGQ